MKTYFINFFSLFCFWSSKKRRKIRKKLQNYFLSPFKNDNELILVSNEHNKNLKYANIKNLDFSVSGRGNVIKIAKNIKFKKSKIKISGNNNYIEINETPHQPKLEISCNHSNNTSLIIGKNFSSINTKIHMAEDDAKIIIGNDCMFSYNVEIWPTDAHSLLHCDTKKLINRVTKPLIIGNHCWLAYGVIVTKNAHLPNNTIVGAGAVVSKKFEKSNTAIAGNPAKIIKENINWDRKSPNLYHDTNMINQ